MYVELVMEVMYVGKYYGNVVFVCCGDNFIVMYRVIWLDNGFNVSCCGSINVVMEWEECVRSYN